MILRKNIEILYNRAFRSKIGLPFIERNALFFSFQPLMGILYLFYFLQSFYVRKSLLTLYLILPSLSHLIHMILPTKRRNPIPPTNLQLQEEDIFIE